MSDGVWQITNRNQFINKVPFDYPEGFEITPISVKFFSVEDVVKELGDCGITIEKVSPLEEENGFGKCSNSYIVVEVRF